MGRGASEAGGAADGKLQRRRMLQSILACALAASGRAAAQPRAGHADNLPAARDLAADAAAAARARIPIFIFFDRRDCPYCARALTRYVVPMSNEAPWRDRALYRQVQIDEDAPLVDFAGGATTHRQLAARYGVTLTPTVIVVDAAGAVAGKPVIGLMTADFYAAYLEEAIDAGLAKLRGARG